MRGLCRDFFRNDSRAAAHGAAAGCALQRHRLHGGLGARARHRARLRWSDGDCRRSQGSFDARVARAHRPRQVNSFLIVRLGSLGDVVHGIPVVAALRQEFPASRIDWMVDPRYVELLNLVVGLDRRIGVDPRAVTHGPARHRFRETIRELRQTEYDAAIDLQGLLKSAMLARSIRARRTIGFPRKHLREPLARLFYTDAPDPGDATHVIYKNLALLAPLQVTDRRVRFPLEVPRTAISQQIINRFEGHPYALINPGAAWPNKRWPPARFGAVASLIAREFGWQSVVLWGPGEQELAHEVVAASSGAAQISPPTT